MEVRAVYGHTSLEHIPADWQVVDLANFCTLQRGFDITEATRVPGTIPVYSSSGLSYFHNKAMVSPPGVITGRKGLLGKVFKVDEPFWPHDTTLWVKDFKGNCPAYVALVLQNFHLERLDAATSVPTLNRNNLAGNFVAIPSSNAEQDAIAEALSDVDALIDSHQKLLAKKLDLRLGAIQELLRPKPEWKTDIIGRLFCLTAGRPKSSKLTPDGRFVVMDMGSVSSDGRTLPFKRTDVEEDLLCLGDLVMPKDDIGGGQIIGKVAYVNRDGGFVLGDHVYRLAKINPRIETRFFFFLINSRYVNEDLKRKVAGSAQLMLNRASVLEHPITFPDLPAEQSFIAAILSEIDSEIQMLETKLNKVRKIKDGMMQKLLTGSIRLL
jgi:type I restriction enzyme S subunit